MDLALKKEDEEFAASFRAWLGAHLRRPPAFVDLADEVAWGREWQATLAADRWVGVHWPSSYGGRSATPVQVALYQSEYARAQAPQPVNRVGINLVGPTLLAHGTEDQRLRYLPAHPLGRGDLVPALQRARRRERPGLALDPGRRRSTGATRSPAARSGRRTPSSPPGDCAWRAPMPTRRGPSRGSPR